MSLNSRRLEKETNNSTEIQQDTSVAKENKNSTGNEIISDKPTTPTPTENIPDVAPNNDRAEIISIIIKRTQKQSGALTTKWLDMK